MPLAILLTLLLGALCGLINAGLIIYTKVNPLVITLGTLYLFAGSGSAAFRYGRSDGVRRYWWIPDGVYRFR
ncbi:ABC transporter permease [Escherichia coli]|uniref:ABC transporter permease n=1 Tax=Escherichia coli TaxID=562 RepID=A0A377DTW3_ECOLX|nr:ABC transporter permease [Escherichia coli]